jgi:hypothetical protein
MPVSSAQVIYGLDAAGTHSRVNVTGTAQIGVPQSRVSLSTANIAYSVKAIIPENEEFVIDITTNDTSATDAWVTGVAQVETATAAGTISGSGNAAVIFTGLNGGPVTLAVPVLSGDTAAVWAGKVREALIANAPISFYYDISGSSTTILITAKPVNVRDGVNIYPGNISSLNLSLDNGTCTGITPATTSASTTSGVATSGCLITDGDGKDFEGNPLQEVSAIYGVLIQANGGIVNYVDGDDKQKSELNGLSAPAFALFSYSSSPVEESNVIGTNGVFTFEATDNTAIVTVSILAISAPPE